MDEETEALLIRFLGDNAGYIQTLTSTLQTTQQAVSVIQRETQRLAEASVAASSKAAEGIGEVAQEEARKTKLMEEGRKVTESVATVSERYAKDIQTLNALLREGAITQETFNRASDKVLASTYGRDKVMAEGQKITRSVMSDNEKYIQKLTQLQHLLSEGAISQETYDRAALAANVARNKVMAEGQRVTNSLMTNTEKYNSQVANLNSLLVQGAITQETFNRGVQHAQMEASKAKTSISQLTDTVHLYASAMLTGVAAHRLWEVTKRSVSLAAQAESDRVSYTTYLKNAERGIKMVKDIQQMAQTTPLTQDTLQHSARTLLQFGVSGAKILPVLREIGDVTGADSERMKHMALAFGQMTQAGRLMGQDLIQMVNAGFNPLRQMSRDTGKSMAVLREEMEEGLITVDLVEQSFKNATKEGGYFFNLMENQGKTLKGMWANMKDDIDAALRDVGQTMVTELKLKEAITGIRAFAKDLTSMLTTMAPQTKALIVGLSALAASVALLTFSLIAGKYAVIAASFAWGILTEVWTAATMRATLLAGALNLVKFSMIGLAAYGAYLFYDILSGAARTRMEMERIKKLTDEITRQGQAGTDRVVNWVMQGLDVDEKLARVNAALDQMKKTAMDIQGMDIGRYLTPVITDKMGLERQNELVKQIENRIKLLEAGGYEELVKLKKQYEDLGFKKAIINPGTREAFLDPTAATYTTMKEVIEFETRMLELAKSNAAQLSARKGRLEELKDELVDAASPAGQLARKMKEIKDDLKETINFSGMDKWNKQVAELTIMMDKLKTDPQVRKRALEEILELQRLARKKELLGEIQEEIGKLIEETYNLGKTAEHSKYNEFLRQGASDDDLARLRYYQKEMLFLKERNRLFEDSKKLIEETKDPLQVYTERVAELKEMLRLKFINETTFNKGLDEATKKFNETTDAANKLRDALDGIRAVAFKSADAIAKMRAYKEGLNIKSPIPLEDIRYEWKEPEWMKRFKAPQKFGILRAENIEQEQNDKMIPINNRGPMQDMDRERMLRFMERIADSNEAMEEKPPVVLRTANLS